MNESYSAGILHEGRRSSADEIIESIYNELGVPHGQRVPYGERERKYAALARLCECFALQISMVSPQC